MEALINLFISFFKIGAFSFGGGYAMLPLMEEEIIGVHNWLSPTEFIDILAISEMTPGPIAINAATFLGYKVHGLSGAIVSTIAVILPSFIVMSLIFYFISKFKNSPYVDWIFTGLRPVVLGLIGAAGVTVARESLVDLRSLIIALTIFFLVGIKKLNGILAIVLAGLMGLLFYP